MNAKTPIAIRFTAASDYNLGWFFDDTQELLPKDLSCVWWSTEAGAWTTYETLPADHSITFRTQGGSAKSYQPADLFEMARTGERWRNELYAHMLDSTQMIAGLCDDYDSIGAALMRRQHAHIVLWENEHGVQGLYVASPAASWHDHLEELGSLEREFPGFLQVIPPKDVENPA